MFTRHSTVVAVLFVLAPLSRAEESSTGADGAAAVPVFHPGGLNAIVQMAAFEAHRRLADPGCQQIFSDFRNASGDRLQDKLDSLGQTGQSFLSWIWFVDAHFEGRCAQTDVLAFTSPGSQVVFYCGERFTRSITRLGLGRLATTILHEELHSLGLGENPPSSVEITRRVELRCGS